VVCDLKDDALAVLRALAVVELAQGSRRGDWRSGSSGVMTPAEFGVAVTTTQADSRRRDRSMHDVVGRARDRQDDALAALRVLAVVELAQRSRRGDWRSGSSHPLR